MERLSEHGHEVRVIDFEIEWRRCKIGPFITQRVVFESVHKATDGGRIMVIRPPIMKLPFLDYFSMLITHRLEIKRQFKEFRPDIVIGFGILNSYMAMRICKRNKLPFLYYLIDELHNLVPQKGFRSIARMIESRNIRYADLAISINEALREYTIEMGAEIAKTRTIRAGIDFEKYLLSDGRTETRNEFGIKDENTVLFFMGWLYEFSGLREVALSLVDASHQFPNLMLMILGRGELGEELRRIRDAYGLQDQILIIDWRPYNEIPRFLAASDICILPAHNNEIMRNIVPIKMYEYMAAGKPVIVTELNGIKKEFGIGNGVIYAQNSESTLGKAIEVINAKRIFKEGEKARNFVKNQDWNIITDQFLAELLKLSESRSHEKD